MFDDYSKRGEGRRSRTTCPGLVFPVADRYHPVFFQIVGEITNSRTIAVGRRIRVVARLKKLYGPGRWRKIKGEAMVRLANRQLRNAELDWYDAHGVGKHGMKVKRLLD